MTCHHIAKNGKLLRCGYTTGSCAAAAAKAATQLLLGGFCPANVQIATPSGTCLSLAVLHPASGKQFARCAIRKDGGDDPDATSGLLIYATVQRCADGICIDGGDGVGRVTKPGLDQPVGAAAINSVPRAMIEAEVAEVCKAFAYTGGISVVLSIPGAEAIAQKTFNPRMGIVGGLSIIGTSGIVEPMSNKALVDTVRLELSQKAARGDIDLLLVPGNYGASFAAEVLHLPKEDTVQCANFIGDALDGAVEKGFKTILLVGHLGKLVKLALGVTNTHSAAGDGRMEALVMAALQAGAPLDLLHEIADCVSTDAALPLLSRHALLWPTMQILQQKIEACLARHVPQQTEIAFVCFTKAANQPNILMQSANAQTLINHWRKKRYD